MVAGKDPGHMDHIARVSMTDYGPVISDLLLNGIPDKRGVLFFTAPNGVAIVSPGQSPPSPFASSA